MPQEDYERYYSAFVHFVRNPQRFDDFLREIGSIDDLEEYRAWLEDFRRRDERKRWLFDLGRTFLKVLVAVGAGLATLTGAGAIIRQFGGALGWW